MLAQICSDVYFIIVCVYYAQQSVHIRSDVMLESTIPFIHIYTQARTDGDEGHNSSKPHRFQLCLCKLLLKISLIKKQNLLNFITAHHNLEFSYKISLCS